MLALASLKITRSRYSLWALILASALILGILYLYSEQAIGLATTIATIFTVAAFTITAVVLYRAGAYPEASPTRDQDSQATWPR